MLEPTRVRTVTELHSNGRLLTVLTNIKKGGGEMAVANTLAYYYTATITAIKSFIAQAACGPWCPSTI